MPPENVVVEKALPSKRRQDLNKKAAQFLLRGFFI